MISVIANVNLIYDGKIFKVGESFECPENISYVLEKLGKVKKVSKSTEIISDSEITSDEEIVPVAELPSLEEVQTIKGKKK